ncbi:MAG: 4Fe-4S dicluster domain-containing protein, partial [Eubacterium sp.]
SHCTKCSACINRCPVQAIQYGKRTKKRPRYVHPDMSR